MRWMMATSLLFVSLSVGATEEAQTVIAASAENAVVEASATTDATATAAEAKIETRKESEIPLNLEAPKKASEESHPLFKMILAISMMGVVGTGAYVFMRKYGKANFAAGKNNQIKVLTQHYLGPKKSLAIIRVAGESILIGVTETNITMIKSLALLDDEVPEEIHNSNFADVFGEVPADKKPSSKASAADTEDMDEEEFSIRGVKDVVSKKLKGMRSFQ